MIERSSEVQGANADGSLLRSMYVQHEPVDVRFAAIGEKGYDGKTRQEFAAECDINNLLAQYERNGTVPLVNPLVGQYLDVSEVPDLQGALDIVERAQQAFMTLSAKVRKEFDNDPVRFMDFAADPANLDQMRAWGLAPPAKPADAAPPVSGSPAAPAAPAAPAPAAAPGS